MGSSVRRTLRTALLSFVRPSVSCKLNTKDRHADVGQIIRSRRSTSLDLLAAIRRRL